MDVTFFNKTRDLRQINVQMYTNDLSLEKKPLDVKACRLLQCNTGNFNGPEWFLGSRLIQKEQVFSHLYLYEIGFVTMWETCISHEPFIGSLVLGIILLKVGEIESNMSQSMQYREMSLSVGVGISTRDPTSLVPGRNSNPSGKISLSCMDTHDGFL